MAISWTSTLSQLYSYKGISFFSLEILFHRQLAHFDQQQIHYTYAIQEIVSNATHVHKES